MARLLAQRGVAAIHVLQGVVQMAHKHSCRVLDQTCELAQSHGTYRLVDLGRLMERPVAQRHQGVIST